jgi:hypothetical protein
MLGLVMEGVLLKTDEAIDYTSETRLHCAITRYSA